MVRYAVNINFTCSITDYKNRTKVTTLHGC
jgi:hypothetical protein